jgi:hypothetical protein
MRYLSPWSLFEEAIVVQILLDLAQALRVIHWFLLEGAALHSQALKFSVYSTPAFLSSAMKSPGTAQPP